MYVCKKCGYEIYDEYTKPNFKCPLCGSHIWAFEQFEVDEGEKKRFEVFMRDFNKFQEDIAQHERNRRLANAAVEAYRRAKRMCGEHNPEQNKGCFRALGYSRSCITCPMEFVAEIEEALKELGEA